MPPIPLFTEKDICQWIDAYDVDKGRAYFHDVSDIQVADNHVRAQVQGKLRLPYRVSIEWKNGRFSGYCTCPVAVRCKHVAAVLLNLLNTPEFQKELQGMRVRTWVDSVRKAALSSAPSPRAKSAIRSILLWTLAPDNRKNRLGIKVYKARLRSNGTLSTQIDPWNNFDRALTTPADFCNDIDRQIIWNLRKINQSTPLYESTWSLSGEDGEAALELLLKSGRFFLDPPQGEMPIRRGEDRPGSLLWIPTEDGLQQPELITTPASDSLLSGQTLWYVDIKERAVGRILSEFPPPVLMKILDAPSLSPDEVILSEALLKDILPERFLPTQSLSTETRSVDLDPTPVLQLHSLGTVIIRAHREYPYSWHPRIFEGAELLFRYGPYQFGSEDKRCHVVEGGETVRIIRKIRLEEEYSSRLGRLGFARVKPGILALKEEAPVPSGLMGLSSESYWPLFMEQIPALEKEGWKINIPPDFRHRYLDAESFEAKVSEEGGDWLSLNLGITVEGKRLSLVPLLTELFSRDDRWFSLSSIQKIQDNEPVYLKGPTGRIRISADRLKVVVGTLIDLFDCRKHGDSVGNLRMSRFDSNRIETLADKGRWQFKGPASIREMAKRLSAIDAPPRLLPPPEFRGTLRPYQQEGLGWLQYLRMHDLSGILADDMGLGKTAQALAHIALEKKEGRLDRPALVVLPTSLVFNWQNEARHFTPGLSVLSLQGKDRMDRFAGSGEADILLTTYPLLWRDADFLLKREYHLLILDEAQVVKNAENHASRIVRKIKTRHRLCLTGTPLENHLGELWSLFDFLMPGFLGDMKNFSRSFRNPIEKQGDEQRRAILARRLRPFILRRKKEEVAQELPQKTLSILRVEIEGGQRDLYETVRSTMDRKIRQEISDKGFARSQIVILDALLKLRQVCCDPRLLKSETARKVKESVKLSLLLELLPSLLEEGRRILLFSQFTGMLDLILPELNQRSIPFVQLRGETVDRKTPVETFQEGRVPLFLISLKAGGVGLNLTAADTVIHYDPWWNPAVENQATDRAHRIGQTKPVFVYKLIVAGSIEEKILALQGKKAELAEGILSPDHSSPVKFSPEDLDLLFSPLLGED